MKLLLFVVVGLSFVIPCAATTIYVDSDSKPEIYWTDSGTNEINRAAVDGSSRESILSGVQTPQCMAIDEVSGKIYWVDSSKSTISRANLDGSNIEDLVTTGLVYPYGITIDTAAGKIYWVDAGTDKIQRANLDGTDIEDVVTTGLDEPHGIDVVVSDVDGSSWADAFISLQDAFDVAVWGDEIRVAGGAYLPDTTGLGDPREASFALVNGVTVKGGYAGFGAADPDERDVELYETILSGDLLGNDIEVSDPNLMQTEPTRLDNCYHVVTCQGISSVPVLDGFTVTGGNASGELFPNNCGGGLLNLCSDVSVINCEFVNNSARWGGGLFSYCSCKPQISGCTFSNNSALNAGGGIETETSSDALITNCIFTDNFAGWGGGLRIYYCDPEVIGCTFTQNITSNGGGGIESEYGDPNIISCVFNGNRSSYGGGVRNYDGNPNVISCSFTGNTAIDWGGGGMQNVLGLPTVINCTFSKNHAVYDLGGGLKNLSGTTWLFNCIFRENQDWYGIGEFSQIYYSCGDVSVFGSSVQGLDFFAGNNNIADEPGFLSNPDDGGDGWGDDPNTPGVDEGANDDYGDLRLSAGSACIDLGYNLIVPVNYMADVDGLGRVVDGDCDGAAVVDMGAYEFDWVYLGDFAGGCDVNLLDLGVLAENWGGVNAAIDVAPYPGGDGVVDLGELLVLAENWLVGTD